MISRERLRKPGWKVLGAIFLIAVITAAAWGTRAAARKMAFFRVRSVEIRGARYLQPSEIVSRLQIDTLASLWDDLEPYQQRVRKHPQVSDVSSTASRHGTVVVPPLEQLARSSLA